ncbi:cyclophilin-like fold protein [Bradyrhizobium sp. 199]|uniref:cyclophilin-like fold protein n=1 Tax=Bradyrhizobium sp. 199 TaxID=2782664 RepID=UPI001FF93EA4|nr:cyclophilin-like fold protein [Bradyrhizobium sp. 199]
MNAPSGLPEKREPSGEAVDDRKNTHMPVKILAAIILVLGLTGTLMAQERIQISSEWGEMTAELADNDAARSLLRMLPVIIQMRDHLRQEKTGNLPSPLKEVARQTHFSKGTLGLWNSDHFVIYYRDGQVPEPGIIILGQAVGNASIFDRPGPVTVHIERAQ